MADAADIAELAVAWAVEAAPGIQGTYDYPPERRTEQTPDMACEITEESVQPNPPAGLEVGPLANLDQITAWQHFAVELWIAVNPDPPDAADAELKGFVALLGASLLSDPSLGGRVAGASPFYTAIYRPPFLEFDDGSRARAAFFRLTIANPLED